jgi:hypothetical protein
MVDEMKIVMFVLEKSFPQSISIVSIGMYPRRSALRGFENGCGRPDPLSLKSPSMT